MDRDAILNIGMEMLAGGASLDDVIAAAANYGVNLYDVYYSDPGTTFEVTTPAPVDTTPPPQEPIYVDPGPVYVDPGPVYEESPPAGGLSVVTPLAPPVVTAQTPVEQPPVVTGGLSTALPPTPMMDRDAILNLGMQMLAGGASLEDVVAAAANYGVNLYDVYYSDPGTTFEVTTPAPVENKPDVTPAATDVPVASSASTNTASLLPGEPYPGYFAEQAALQAAAATTQQQQARDQATGLQQFQQQATQQTTPQGGLSSVSPVVTDVRGPTTSPPVEETRNQWGDLPYDPTLTDTVSTTTDVVKPPTDMEIAQQMAAGIIPANMLYDVNKDGQVTSADALLIGQGTPVRTLQELLTTAGSPLVSADTAGGVTSADTITGATGNDAVKPTTPPPTSSLLSGVDKYIDPISGKDETQLLKQLLDKQLKEQGITNLDQLSLENISEGLEDFVNSPQTRTALINKTTGAEVNPVLFDDGYGTKFVVTPNGIEKQFVAAEKVAKQAASILDPNSTGGAWTTQAGESSGPGFGTQGMLNQIGQRIVERTGITDLSQLGARQVPVEGYYRTVSGGEGGDVSEYVPASTKTEFFDKATGQTIDWDGSLGTWGQGPGTTYGNVTTDAEGKLKVETLGDDSTDPFIKAVAKAGPVLNIANVLTGGALTPLTLAVNSINAVANENPFAIAASFAGLGGYTGLIDTATASAIQAGANAANAVKEGNLLGALATIAGSSLGQGIGTVDLGNGITVTDALNAASAVDKAVKGDIAGALADAGKAANSTELKTAGAALQLVNALESGNLNAIANAAQGLYSGVNNLVTQSQVGQLLVDSAGIGAIDADLGGDLLGTGALSTLKTDTVTGGLSGAADTAGGGNVVDEYNVVSGGLPTSVNPAEDAQIAQQQRITAANQALADYLGPGNDLSREGLVNQLTNLVGAEQANTLAAQADATINQRRVSADVINRYSKVDPEFGTPALSRDVAVKELEAAGFKTEQANDILDGVERQVAAARTAALDTAAQNLAAINAGAGEFAGADQRAAVAAGAGEFTGADKAAAVNTRIANAASFNDAYAIARQEFGPNATFNYQGKLYSTATAQERPDLTGATKPTTEAATTADLGTPYVAPNGMHNRAAFIQAGGGTSDADYAKYVNAVNAVISQGQSGTLIKPSSVNSEGKDLPSTTGPVTVEKPRVDSVLGSVVAQGVANFGANSIAGPLSALGFTDAGAAVLAKATELANAATAAQGEDITRGKQEINAAINKVGESTNLKEAATSFGNLIYTAFKNPKAFGAEIGSEIVEEILQIGPLKGLGFWTREALGSAVENGGAAYNQEYANQIKQGVPVEEAHKNAQIAAGAASGASLAAMAGGALVSKGVGALTGSADDVIGGLLGKSKEVAKATTRESIQGGAEEGLIAAAVDKAVRGEINPANVLSGIAGGALYEGPTSGTMQGGNLGALEETSTSIGSGIDLSQTMSSTINSGIKAGEDTSAVISSSVTTAIQSGGDPATIVSTAVDGGIKAGGDTAVVIDSSVTTALNDGGDTATVISSAVNSGITSGADASVVIDSAITSGMASETGESTVVEAAVTSGITSGADVNTVISTAVNSSIKSGGDAATIVASTVSAGITAGGDTTSSVSGAVSGATNAGTSTDTAVSSAIDGAIKAGGSSTEATSAAVSTTIIDALVTGGDTSSTITKAVEGSVSSSMDSGTALIISADSALSTGAAMGLDTGNVVTSVITGAVNGGTDSATAIASTVSVAISQGTDINTAIDAAQQTDTKATITIDNNGTVTTQTDATTSTVSIDTTTGITSTVTINNNTNSAVITEVDTKSGVTTETTINNDGTVTTDTTLHVVPPEDKTTGTTTSPPTGTTTGTTTSPTPTVPEVTTPTVTTTAPTVTTTTPATTPTATQSAKSSSAGMMIPGMITGAKLANDWLGGKLLASQTREKYLGPLAQYFAEVQDLPAARVAPETVEEEMRLPYYTYGQEPSLDQIFGEIPIGAPEESEEEPVYRAGGSVMNPQFMYAQGGLSRQDFREGKHVSGPGDGQSDDIPAMLADGEFVFPSDVVSALGNGSTKAGTEKLYEMMHAIRRRARSKGPKDLPPPAFKSPLDYLKKR